jgi:hypothetical protein
LAGSSRSFRRETRLFSRSAYAGSDGELEEDDTDACTADGEVTSEERERTFGSEVEDEDGNSAELADAAEVDTGVEEETLSHETLFSETTGAVSGTEGVAETEDETGTSDCIETNGKSEPGRSGDGNYSLR